MTRRKALPGYERQKDICTFTFADGTFFVPKSIQGYAERAKEEVFRARNALWPASPLRNKIRDPRAGKFRAVLFGQTVDKNEAAYLKQRIINDLTALGKTYGKKSKQTMSIKKYKELHEIFGAKHNASIAYNLKKIK